jgi:hypothetical protein
VDERFTRLEEKVVNMSGNMFLLMAALASKLGPFEEVGGLNSEIRLDGILGDYKDSENESQKELEKEQSSSNSINPS